ncbi:Uncharacterised protein [uncultured Ruminococcus sp.]|jgi:hypothetical protein|nr:Uncharacterised protein [uncultured Ruminococcus sp.]DAV33310.1 MAG TPA: hypothetical protein [Caudoviricetes sp.]
MKFKSNAKYKEEPKTGSIFTLKYNSLGISIHKYVGCGDSLFLNSKALNIDNYDLGTEDFEEAVNKAKEVVMREVKKIREDAYRFYSDNSIEFDRY